MQLPSVPRMLAFCAVVLVLGLGGVAVGLGEAFVNVLNTLAEVFKARIAASPPKPQALMPLVDIALRRLF